MPEFEPFTYYNVVVRCNTADGVRDTSTQEVGPCPNYLREWPINEVYSNAGQPVIQDIMCDRLVEILSGVKMDPQPEIS